MTPKQVEAFFRAIYPEGDRGCLHSHARTYFEALLGADAVPTFVPTNKYQDLEIGKCMVMGKVLIDLGNAMLSAAMEAKSK